MKMRRSCTAYIIILFVLSVFATACKPKLGAQAPPGLINVINASPGSLSMNFYLNGLFITGPSLFYTERSGYIQNYVGTMKFDAVVGGTNQLINTMIVDLGSAKYYSMFLVGLNKSPELVFMQDDLSGPAAGKAKVRFVHLSPDAAVLDLSIKGASKLFNAQVFKSASNFVEIDPKTYVFQLQSGSTVLAESVNAPLEAGRVYTIWAGGLTSGSGSTALSVLIMTNK
jgi:hypothetical protein